MKKTIQLLDYCPSDYFKGHSSYALSVPVYSTMTHEQVAEGIIDEINSIGFDFLNDEEIKLFEEYADEMRKEGDKVFIEIMLEDEEKIDMDYFEPSYLYFGVCQLTTVNGITFLNP